MKRLFQKHSAIKSVALVAALVIGTAAHATTYTAHYTYVGKAGLSSAQQDDQLQADTASCDSVAGVQLHVPSANYRSCMLQHDWKYNFVTRDKVQVSRAPADPYFSTDAKVAPGHFIDHDNGMDCQNTGGAEICDPPKGTVHYFDPDQGLPCTRTGAMSICSNM